MSNFNPDDREPIDEDWQVEVSDLDPPRSPKVVMPFCARRFVQRWQTPQSRRRLRRVSNVALGLIVVLVIALLSGNQFFALLANQLRAGFGLFQQARPGQSSPSLLDLTDDSVRGQDGIACLLDAQWSPRGDAIAVLGYEDYCPSNHDVPGVLNIYDARTGKLSAQWQLDDTILNIMNAPTIDSRGILTHGVLATSSFQTAITGSANMGSTRLLPFSYIHVMWSPDGQQLALSFIVYMQQQPFFGILVMNANGRFSHVIFQPPNLNQRMPIEWNIATGQALGFTPVPAAMSYRWQANGSLVPLVALSGGPQPIPLAGPVGNPDGSPFFTIWQPGLTAFTSVAEYYRWSTSFSAWSPDGRYLIDDINLQGFYKQPSSIIPDIQALAKLNLQQNRLLSIHDVRVLELQQGHPLVSWRPDGRVLATYYARGMIAFSDSHTGQALQTINLTAGQRLLAGHNALLRWSPDGSHLLLSSASYGLLKIWGPGQLPQL